MAGAEHEGGEGDGLADGAILDELAGGLDAGAHEGVGAQPISSFFLAARSIILLGFIAADAQGLFGVGVLAGLQGVHGDRARAPWARSGSGSTSMDGSSMHLIDAADLGDAELGGLRLGGLRVQIRARGDLDDGEVLGHPQIRR